jgi:SAM-dependent methyltransferase
MTKFGSIRQLQRQGRAQTTASILLDYLKPNVEISWDIPEIPVCRIDNWSPGMLANATFFGDPIYCKKYFNTENSSREVGNRWRTACGNWDDKIVVDIGCGPGNLYAIMGGKPRVTIGVDISYGSLEHALELGYTPILADAHDLPFIDGFADIVMLNATLHHCDRMAEVLAQAARLVRPGGLLVTDEDPLAYTGTHRGLALLIIKARERFPMYWLPGRSALNAPSIERELRLKTEIHNSKPGDGVTPDLYRETLIPLGFTIQLYPHYHNVGAELLQCRLGRLGIKDRLIRAVSAADAPQPPQSVMCIARKDGKGVGKTVDLTKPIPVDCRSVIANDRQ